MLRDLLKMIVLVVSALLPFVSGNAFAQRSIEKYPSKSIRLIVPFAPAGGTDIMARALAEKLAIQLGQPVVIDNRAGGGGRLGAELLVRAAPDGYTFILASASYATNAALFSLPYDPINDTSVVSLVGESFFMITLHPSVPAKSTKELIALAKSNPMALNFASTGTGGITHFAYELFNLMAGTKMTHVPYRGAGPLLVDLMSGHVQLTFGGMLGMLPPVKAGKLKGIAITAERRNSAIPDVPTVAETLPGYEAANWYGVWGPKGVQKEIVGRLGSEIAQALKAPDLAARMVGQGVTPIGGSPTEMLQVLKRDTEKWAQVAKRAGVKQIQ